MKVWRTGALIVLAFLLAVGCAGKKKAAPTATEPVSETEVTAPETPPEEVPQPLEGSAPEEETAAGEESAEGAGEESEAPLVPPSLSEAHPFVMPEFPAPPESNLAKFRDFWLGMSIENFAFVAFPPTQSETDSAAAEGEVESEPEAEATPEESPSAEEGTSAAPAEGAGVPAKAPTVYRLLPLVLDEPEFSRFICNDPGDPSIGHATFVFFKDRLHSIEVFYRSGYFDKVILADFIAKVKEKFGEPSAEEWKKKDIEGKLTWEDDKYKVQLAVIGGRPFYLKYLHKEIDGEAQTYIENLRKEHSTKKIEGVKF